jgi:hypothetical protein
MDSERLVKEHQPLIIHGGLSPGPG